MITNEMIEKVAFALRATSFPNPDPDLHVLSLWYAASKNAIAAMQEPTQAMIDAGCEGRYDPVLVKAVWLDMINAALL